MQHNLTKDFQCGIRSCPPIQNDDILPYFLSPSFFYGLSHRWPWPCWIGLTLIQFGDARYDSMSAAEVFLLWAMVKEIQQNLVLSPATLSHPLVGMSTFRFFLWTNISCFFGPLEKKCILFRFLFWIQRKAKIRLLFINKKFVFISKCFIIFYSLKRTKYSLIFY